MMKKKSASVYKHIFAALLAGLFISLACNFPMLQAQRGANGDFQTPGPPTILPGGDLAPGPTETVSEPVIAPTEAPKEPFETPLVDENTVVYNAQPGDTLSAISSRFGVDSGQVKSPQTIPPEGYIEPGQMLFIPWVIEEVLSGTALLPDSEIVYSPSTVGFDIDDWIAKEGGFLSGYSEEVDGERLSGGDIVWRVAAETSTNPRLLLAFLEYRSGWVRGQPENREKEIYPLGFYVPDYRGLYKELSLAAKQLNIGYYGWRLGTLTELVFPDGRVGRLEPRLNAGSVALEYLFSKFYRLNDWNNVLYGQDSFLGLYEQMFGDPWAWAKEAAAGLVPQLAQPVMELPFAPGERWSFTGGPHKSWNTGTPPGALDFSPVTGDPPCSVSSAWVTASAAGIVTRSEHNYLALDLDEDGYEQTGWVLFYLHVAEDDRVPMGRRIEGDERLGHPSCEGGDATGTHVHIARKYNGEWIPADGPLPFVLSGWQVADGSRYYEGYLIRGEEIIAANPGGSRSSIIVRQP